MKKWLLLFLGTLLFSFSFKVYAVAFSFEWKNTFIEVPLYANITDYNDIPRAYLYRDNELLRDAQISYLNTGDWLYFLSDVDTTKVGTYQVWYKAFEKKYCPGQCNGYKTLVTFKVVDKEPPVFSNLPDVIRYQIGSPKPNYAGHFNVTDNSGSWQLSIDDSNVNYTVSGTYEVWLKASDGSNMIDAKIIVEVYDSAGPIVTFLAENNRLVIGLNEEVNLKSYFKAFDKTDGDVIDTISYKPFTTDEVGSFSLEVSFSDHSGNTTSVQIIIEVVDRRIPEIKLFEATLVLSYGSDYFTAIKSNIKSATLGNSDITEEVLIDYTKIKNQVGTYQVSYKYGLTVVYCEVKILANDPPQLVLRNVSTPKNTRPDYLQYIIASDISDSDIMNKIEIDDSLVNYQKAGTYYVMVSVVNSSNLTSGGYLYVTVYDSESEEKESKNKILFYGGVAFLTVALAYSYYRYRKKNCNKPQNTI